MTTINFVSFDGIRSLRSQKNLEIERAKTIELPLVAQQKTTRLQRLLLRAVSGGFAITLILGLSTFWQYRQAKISEFTPSRNPQKPSSPSTVV